MKSEFVAPPLAGPYADSEPLARVERVAAAHPERIALVDAALNVTVDYSHLVQSCRDFTEVLGDVGVSGSIVLVALPRSLALVVAELGIWSAGAVSVSIGDAVPHGRLSLYLSTARPAAIVLGVDDPLTVRDTTCAIVRVAQEGSRVMAVGVERYEQTEGPAPALGDQYGVFTSGSTGAPKLVTVRGSSLANLVDSYAARYGLGTGTVSTMLMTASFDVHVLELWSGLCSGGTVVIVDDRTRLDSSALLSVIEHWGVEIVFLPTALLPDFIRGLPETAAPTLRRIVTGGDRLTIWPVSAHPVVVDNAYGPAECTVIASAYTLGEPDAGLPPIGAPIPGVTAYVVDSDGALVDRGIAGELWIGGPCVARGYFGRPDLTSQRFLPDPFVSAPSTARVYATGDVVVMSATGELEFRGRIDDQLQVRGSRVEPQEVESVLRDLRGVTAAAVVGARDGSGELSLVAFVTGQDLDAASLRRESAERLLAHMVPTSIQVMDELPLNQNEKVDRLALRGLADQIRASVPASLTTGADAITKMDALAAVWESVLGVPALAATDTFFDAGGHSLAALRVVSDLQLEYGLVASVGDLLAGKTLAQVAESLTDRPSTTGPVFTPVSGDALYAASPSQQRAFFEQAMDDSGTFAYQYQFAIHVEGRFDPDRWRRAAALLISRNDVLRSTFHSQSGQLRLRVHSPFVPEIEIVDVSDDAGIEPALRAFESLPWAEGELPLVRWRILRLGPERWIVSQVEHHFVHDGWSVGLVLGDLIDGYHSGIERAERPSFALWGEWFDEHRDALREKSLAYWVEALRDVPPRPAAPPASTAASGIARAKSLRGEVSPALRDAIRTRYPNQSEFSVLLSCFARSLAQVSGQSDIVVGSALAGRPVGTEATVGMFVNTVCLRLDGSLPLERLLDSASDQIRGALEHQTIPFDDVIRAWRASSGLPTGLPFTSMFSMHNAEMPQLALGAGLVAEIEYRQNGTSKAPLDVLVIERHAGVDLAASARAHLELVWEFAAELFDTRDIEALRDIFEAELARAVGWTCDPAPIPARVSGAPASPTPLGHVIDSIKRRRSHAPALVDSTGFTSWLQLSRVFGQPLPPEAFSTDVRGRGFVEEALAALNENRPIIPAGESQRERLRRARGNLSPDSAYAVLTSGSTGEPKLVDVSRDALANHIAGFIDLFDLTDSDVVASFSAFGFDAIWEEALPILAVGGTLVIGDVESTSAVHETLLAHDVTVVGMSTALFSAFTLELARRNAGVPRTLRAIVIGGEAYDDADIRRWLDLPGSERVRLVSSYGPSEATIAPLWIDVAVSGRSAVPVGRPLLGRPMPGVTATVVDRAGKVVPRGAVGELWIGGVGVATGYAGRPELTADRFLSDPHGPSSPGSRIYRTGDRVRMAPSGVVEFLGRLDDQIKIRGFRVEPGEVEATLLTVPGIAEAVVVDTPQAGGGQRLVAFVIGTGTGTGDLAECRRACEQVLPPYMVPAVIEEVTSFPLTQNGKLDRAALRSSAEHVATTTVAPSRPAPRAGTEANIALIWKEVLEIGVVGADDTFIDLGGHSLAAMRVVTLLHDRFGIETRLRDILSRKTLRQLALTCRTPSDPA